MLLLQKWRRVMWRVAHCMSDIEWSHLSKHEIPINIWQSYLTVILFPSPPL